jgi:hypothetical protein
MKVVLPQIDINWLRKLTTTGGGSNQLQSGDYKVCDVKINDHCIIIHTLNMVTRRFEAMLLKLSDPILVQELVTKTNVLSLNSMADFMPGPLDLTPTKLLNLSPHEMRIFDFL